MKLKIGENLRRLRKERGLTQEQFAEAVGVSFQAVSRWEKGTAYPDMELLPALSSFFSVSVDSLIGCPEMTKNEQAKILLEELRRKACEKPFETERVVALIREVRRHCVDSPHIDMFWPVNRTMEECYRSPAIIPEVRKTAEQILQRKGDPATRDTVIFHMAMLEEEERLDTFLKRYSVPEESTRNSLRLNRYSRLRDWDRYIPLVQARRFTNLCKLFTSWTDPRKPMLPAEALYINDMQLHLLHAVNWQTPDGAHPISGDGGLDCFADQRLWLGAERVNALAGLDRTEEALTALADVVELLEHLMAIEQPTALRSHSPWLSEVVFTAQPEYGRPHNDPDEPEKRLLRVFNKEVCYDVFPTSWYETLTEPGYVMGSEWGETVRRDPHYIALTNRIQALVVTR